MSKHSHSLVRNHAAGWLVTIACTLAATVPAQAAGLTLHSGKGDCQITVPADWRADKLLKSSAQSADGSMWAVISSSAPDTSLTFSKQVMESSYPPVQVFEDTPQRLFYRYAADGKPGYYVGVPGRHHNVCGAQITVPTGKDALVRQIAASVGSTP